MIKKFQHKLLLAFGLLIVLIIALVSGSVNSTIDSVSQVRIESDLLTAHRVFDTFTLTKRRSKSEAAASLIKSHPVLRALLGSLSASSEDIFGSESTVTNSSLEETNARLFSTVESLDLYQDSQIFAITDNQANILFTKTDPKKIGINLSELTIVKTALAGNEVSTRWGSEQKDFKKFPLLPQVDAPTLFEVFVKPLVFGKEVKGLMIVGFPITAADLGEIQKITRARIAFSLENVIYGDPDGLLSALPEEIRSGKESITEFKKDGETFLASVSKLSDSLDTGNISAVIFRSKSEELGFYKSLKNSLNLICLVAVLISLVLATFISSGVTTSIRDLIVGVQEVRKGNLDYNVVIKGADELHQLAANFNLMTKDLKEKEHIKSTFKRYVSPRIVNTLLEDRNKLKLGGDKRRLIIYFADIAGFTALSEKFPPEQTIEFLNGYLSKVATLIEGSEGVIDKYIGDAIMAYWLPPENGISYEKTACEVALKHREIVEEFKKEIRLKSENVKFDIRIGIHAGDAIIGNIGSSERMDYTIIGDNVNLASRLESLNKQYGSQILVSDDVARACQEHFIFRELDRVTVVGKTEPVLTYQLIDLSANNNSGLDLQLQTFYQGLADYRSGNFATAKTHFEKNETDPVARKFAERCTFLIEHPPKTWDGLFRAIEK